MADLTQGLEEGDQGGKGYNAHDQVDPGWKGCDCLGPGLKWLGVARCLFRIATDRTTKLKFLDYPGIIALGALYRGKKSATMGTDDGVPLYLDTAVLTEISGLFHKQA